MPMSDNQKTPKILIPEIKLQARISEMAEEIRHDYHDKEIVAICVLKGSSSENSIFRCPANF
jgi:hypoxanthine-guanine phosphoribosyltransferase